MTPGYAWLAGLAALTRGYGYVATSWLDVEVGMFVVLLTNATSMKRQRPRFLIFNEGRGPLATEPLLLVRRLQQDLNLFLTP